MFLRGYERRTVMANLYMRFPGGKGKCLTLSYDDGVINDRRFIALLKSKGLKCTMNINSGCYADKEYDDFTTTHRRLTKEAALELYKSSGFEIASHAVTHPFLEQLPPAECTREILQDRINHEQDYGVTVRGFAYPFGTYNDSVIASLKACGMVYARTVWSSHNFDIPKDWFILRPTCHHEEKELPELTDKFLSDPIWNSPKLFYLWGHSYEFDFHNNWEIIETFAEKTGNRDDIWYATNIEVYDYIDAYNRLIFNAGMTRVYNPSVMTLWFEYDKKTYCIEGGATLEL